MKRLLYLSFIVFLFGETAVPPTLAQNEPIIHAVMFWMDGCPHCHDVLDTVLPPLQMQHGEQLDIVLVEIITIKDTEQLYLLGDSLGLEKNDIGVPLLLIGDAVLVGSDQIRDQLPAKIAAYLEAGGWQYQATQP